MSPSSPHTPEVLVLDVNETLSDLSALGPRFAEVGASPDLVAPWFAGVLRDAFALTVMNAAPAFADVAAAGLRTTLTGTALDRPLEEAVEHVMTGFTALPVHPDVTTGLPRLAALGIRLVTMSNGATSVAETLLERTGLREHVHEVLSVDEAGAWKPDERAYAFAVRRSSTAERAAMMVACHPWDLAGAHAAGLRTAYVDRTGAPWPSIFPEPDLHVGDFDELADALSPAG